MKPEIKAGDIVRITKRKTKLQPYVQAGQLYPVKAVETTSAGATVLVLNNTKLKGKTMRVNEQRFDWEITTLEKLAKEKQQRDFAHEVKTDCQRILEAFTMQEHIQIAFVPLVINELAWHYAFKAMELGARDRVQDLKKLSRVLKELRVHYERTVCKDLKPSDQQRIKQQTMEFMAEFSYYFTVMYYTADNLFCKLYGKQPFEEMRIYALLSMLMIRYCDEHNRRCDDMMRAKLGKIRAAVRMPDMDSLYAGMACFTGEIGKFPFEDTQLQMCLGILRNNLHKCEFEIAKSAKA